MFVKNSVLRIRYFTTREIRQKENDISYIAQNVFQQTLIGNVDRCGFTRT